MTRSFLRQALLDLSRSLVTESEIEYQLYSRMLKTTESFTKYFYAITDLNAKLKRPKSDSDLIEIMIRNVNVKVRVSKFDAKNDLIPDLMK